MKRVILLLLILTFSHIFSNEYKGSNFLIKQKRKSYLDIYLTNEGFDKLALLDDGLLVNSRIFIKDSNRRFYLRDNGKFFTKVEKGSFTIIWKVDNLDFVETYRDLGESIEYSIEVSNRGKKGRLVGVYFVYDTILGEKIGKHFIDSEGEVYNREKSFQGFDIPGRIKSVNESNQGIEFIFPKDKDKKPDRVILGNWEMLARSKKWPYIPVDGSMFSYGYYSINDSGLGLVYPSVSLDSGESVTHSFNIRFLTGGENQGDAKEVVETEDSKWDEETIPEVPLTEDGNTESQDVVSEVSTSVPESLDDGGEIDLDTLDIEFTDEPLDPEKEELLIMLEYIQKKKRGEDVSEYDFDDEYIIEKLKEINE